MSVDLRKDLGDGYKDEDYDKMRDGMKDGKGIKLPFAHLVIWAANGDRKCAPMKTQSPVSYFGGWNADAEIVTEMRDSGALKVDLAKTNWMLTSKGGRDGDYTAYETRSLHIAPICKRLSWIDKDGKSRMPDYDPVHKRSHLQVLGLIGCTIGEGAARSIQYIAPAIISVKGKGQTEALSKAFSMWSKSIDALRGEMNAKGLPLFAWWETIGTSGEQPDFVKMGNTKDASEITPVKAIMATDKLTAEQMGKRFVGKDLFQLSVQLLAEAQEWLGAWKTPSKDTRGKAPAQDSGDYDNGSGYGDAHEGDEFHGGMAPPPGKGSEIPF